LSNLNVNPIAIVALSTPAPPHTTIRQHSGQVLYAAALGVGHRTMAAVVSNLRQDMSADIEGCCDYTPSNHGGPLPSRHLGSLHAKSAASSRPPIWIIMVE
jgi:hypothetical protein